MTAVDEAIRLSRRLGLFDRSVFFNDWVPYAERQNYLLEADLGITLHRSVLETRFAFRTRLLDCLWAGLPVIATEGDTMSRHMQQEELGRVVAPGDKTVVAGTILELLARPNLKRDLRPRFEAVAAHFQWEVVAAPLTEFCRNPCPSPDRAHLRLL